MGVNFRNVMDLMPSLFLWSLGISDSLRIIHPMCTFVQINLYMGIYIYIILYKYIIYYTHVYIHVLFTYRTIIYIYTHTYICFLHPVAEAGI